MSALVSIITPTFNHEKYIQECIDSVLAQTYTNWELIIIDDGSTDNTAKIIKTISEKEPRITYIFQENKGLLKLKETYNHALAISKGDYVAILEGDDYWLPKKLELQLRKIAETDAIFCWGIAEARDDNKKYLEKYPINFSFSKLEIYQNTKPAYILNMMYEDFPIPLTWLIKRNALLKIGGFIQSSFALMLDRDTIYELSLHGRFAFVEETIGIYRRQINQATGGRMLEISEATGRIFENFCKKLPKEIRKNVLFSDSEISTLNNNHMLVAYSRYGRYKLRIKEYREAKIYYSKSIIHQGDISVFMWRIRSMIGFLFALFHLDLEGFLKIVGKKSYK